MDGARLEPEFTTFPAGAPQVAAAQAKSWDVGGTGSVPAVLGAARYGLLTIGITNDESKANVLMVRGDKSDAVQEATRHHQGPEDPADHQLDRRLRRRSCLKKWGVGFSDVQFVNHGPGADHLGDYLQQRRLRRRVGAEQLHAGGEGRREDDLHRRGRRRRSCRAR